MSSTFRVAAVDRDGAARLSTDLGLRPLTGRILWGRGFRDTTSAGRFLDPRLADLRPPAGVADLDRALDRLRVALTRGERVGVFGDYDVDGVTSAAVLGTGLRACGFEVQARAASRHAGYGLPPDVVAAFAQQGCRMIVTGDCGTSDHESLALAVKLGIDVVVIDHHQVPDGPSAAYALINPHRADDSFPFKGLASCGLAFYLIAALRSRLRAEGHERGAFEPRSLLDLVALGTVADLVPLRDENRAFVAAGLRALAEARRPGVRALSAVAQLTGKDVTEHDIGFRLAPRLNAAGRLGDAQLALDLLMAESEAEAQRLAAKLDEMNQERQRIQEGVLRQALVAAAADADAPAVVVGGEGWHHGVVGIVAAKLVDKYGKPTVVVAFEGGVGRGSLRSASGVNLYEALKACAGDLQRYGGHAAAAGVTVEAGRFDAFKQTFQREVGARLVGHVQAPIEADVEASIDELDVAMARELRRLAPFGMANPQPVIALRNVRALSTRVVGEKHLQLRLQGDGVARDAIAFGFGDADPGPGAALDVLAHAELDEFRGEVRARLRVKHLLPAGSDATRGA